MDQIELDIQKLRGDHEESDWEAIFDRWYSSDNMGEQLCEETGVDLRVALLSSYCIKSNSILSKIVVGKSEADAVSSNPLMLLWMMEWHSDMQYISSLCFRVAAYEVAIWTKTVSEESVDKKRDIVMSSWFQPFEKEFQDRYDNIDWAVEGKAELVDKFSNVQESVRKMCTYADSVTTWGWFQEVRNFIDEVYGDIDVIERNKKMFVMMKNIADHANGLWFNHPLSMVMK